MAAHFVRDIREIPLKVMNRRVGDEHVTLLQACYDNPLFDEDGKTYHGGKPVTQENNKAHPRSKDYMHTLPGPHHEVKFKSSKSSRKKRFCVVAFIILTVIVVAVVIGLLAHFLGENKNNTQELYSTSLPADYMSTIKCKDIAYFTRNGGFAYVFLKYTKSFQAYSNHSRLKMISTTDELKGSLRITKGPFSVYTKSLEDKSSSDYINLAKSFHYKMKTIFQESEYSSIFNSTEIILLRSGSVSVNFLIHLNKPIGVTDALLKNIKNVISDGLDNSLLHIDNSSLKIYIDAIIAFTTRPTPQESCEPVRLLRCVNKTDYTSTAFPNFMGQVSQDHVLSISHRYDIMFRDQCYGYENDFWCNIMVPPCHNGKPLPPCRSYCQDVFSHCKYPGNMSWPFTDCSILPDSSDPDVCRPNPYRKTAGKCVPIKSERCKAEGRTMTTFPNLLGNIVETETREMVELMKGIEKSTNCYKHVMTFACATFLPKCSGNPVIPNHYIPPCKSLCQGFRDRCEIFMDIFSSPWPSALNCSALPDSPDPSVCTGYDEAHEPPQYDKCKYDEINCDNNTCIPMNWVCDNTQDCKDNSDESNCAACKDDEFNCSPASSQCIPSTSVCDGKMDCYEEIDESECAKLTSDESHYKLEILNGKSNAMDKWEEVCSDGWEGKHSTIVCKQLGYRDVSSTLLSAGSNKPKLVLTDQLPDTDPKLIQSYLAKNNCSSDMVVKLVCEDPICGIRPAHHKPLLRIVNGNEAAPGSWPWLVSMHGGLDETFFCGASILNERWLITAAHCVGGGASNVPAWTLKAGAARRHTFSSHRQVRKAKKLFVHPDFIQVDNDIALIQLDQPFIFTDYVRPVCLPKQGDPPADGRKCLAAGWGRPSETANHYMRAMQELYLDVVNWKHCKNVVENAEQKLPYKISKNMFCAGGTIGHDACSGDSGGPFVCKKENTTDEWVQYGIVSWGVGCAVPNVPGIYTVLPHYIDWINEIIANNTL